MSVVPRVVISLEEMTWPMSRTPGISLVIVKKTQPVSKAPRVSSAMVKETRSMSFATEILLRSSWAELSHDSIAGDRYGGDEVLRPERIRTIGYSPPVQSDNIIGKTTVSLILYVLGFVYDGSIANHHVVNQPLIKDVAS